MARDRKRSRQRRPRRSDAAPRPVREGASAQAGNRPVRSDLPGSLDHAGDVDEFDAAIVRGAEGMAAATEAEGDAGQPAPDSRAQPALATSSGRGGDRNGEAELALQGSDDGRSPAVRPTRPEGNRAIAFLRASWAELQRVQWPDRRQVSQATAVVLGFVAIAGAYLGIADWAAQKIVNFIL